MKISINKTMTATIALILMLTMVASLTCLPAANAVTAVPDRPTGAYISTNPDLVGLGQEITVNAWIYPSPAGPNYEMGTALHGFGGVEGMHFNDLTVTFTRPDGSKDTFMPLDGSWEPLGLVAGMTEEVGTMWFMYKPNQIGTWSVSCSYPGETFTAKNYSVYYKPSTSRAITFEVQQDLVQIGLPPVQLPTGYWERPINAQNREWSSIAGDWLSAADGPGLPGIYTNFNPYTTAPNSAHILWKLDDVGAAPGGIAGGAYGSLSYSAGAITPYIWNGRLYYTNTNWDGSYIVCRDLLTTELIWQRPGSISSVIIGAPTESAVQEYGGTPTAYIWSTSATTGWIRYNAWTGAQVGSTITTNIPNLGGPNWLDGNIAYCLRQGTWSGTTLRRPFNELIKWNMSKVTGNNWATGIVWNVTLKQSDGTGPGEGSRGSSGPELLPDKGIAVVYTTGEGQFYAYDLESGVKKWNYYIGYAAQYQYWTPDGKMIAQDSANMMLYCYDVSATGMTELWKTSVGTWPWGSQPPRNGMAYGNFYCGTYDGTARCIDLATGKEEWTYYIGNTTETPFGTWAIYSSPMIADGKVYLWTSEHTPTQPRTRGNMIFCLDAYTGEHLWNISEAISPDAVAQGCLTGSNEYDGLQYCFGKGKTETTVSSPLTAISLGQSIVLQGSVADLSPASAGTPAISDADMTAWMEYLHFQKPIPMNAKGVEVSLDTVDPNNNFVHIATVTSDSSGLYSYKWKPEVPGKYTVIATFAGSESYWASYAETAVGVDEAPAATPSAETIVPDNMPIYATIIGVGIAIIVAIAIAVVLILRKKP